MHLSNFSTAMLIPIQIPQLSVSAEYKVSNIQYQCFKFCIPYCMGLFYLTLLFVCKITGGQG